jgi:DNA (cytosine-5)-methyltransferase 1
MKMIDFFSGIGGGSLGFRRAGFEPVFACDSDAKARLIYASNFHSDIKNDLGLMAAKDIPHPEVIFAAPPDTKMGLLLKMLEAIQPRAFLLEYPARLISHSKLAQHRQFDLGSFKCWHETLNSNDYGLAQKRKKFYVIGFRKDVRTTFSVFPFPEVEIRGRKLESVLEKDSDPKLLATAERLKYIERRNAANAAIGTGYRHMILGPGDIAPSIPMAYWKDYRSILVDSGSGPRRLSVLECKRLMGFPDDFKLPVSDSSAYRLLVQASCPPMVAAVARELKDWLSC